MMLCRYCAIPIVVRMTIRETTTSNSIIVKPRSARLPESPIIKLPVLVFRPVERRSVERRVDVEHVLPAPPRGVRLVLVRAHAPFGRAHHRIDRNVPQVLQLPAGRVVG